MRITRCGRTFEYMEAQDIHVVYTTHNKNVPSFYINEIKQKHEHVKIHGYHINNSLEYIGNKTEILYEIKGVLLISTANTLMRSNNISMIRYNENDVVYVSNCILLNENNNIICTGYTTNPKGVSLYACHLKCLNCNREWHKQMKKIVSSDNTTHCLCNGRTKFNGSSSVYFYVNRFIYNGETVYKYGIAHDLSNRRQLFKSNNGIDSEQIIAVLFDNSLQAADLEDTLKYTNLINHMPHVKIKDGWTELTDEAGLQFIIEELTYMDML